MKDALVGDVHRIKNAKGSCVCKRADKKGIRGFVWRNKQMCEASERKCADKKQHSANNPHCVRS